MNESDTPSDQRKPALEIPLGSVRFGDLRRLSPIGRDFGYERGTPVDRHYIEGFLARNAGDVRGRVLELANNDYTKRFGDGRVERSDVLSLQANPDATLIGDLTLEATLPEAAFDCIIFTQALQYMYDLAAAVRMLHRALKPAGILLATFPAIVPTGNYPGRPEQNDPLPPLWSFTRASIRRLLEDGFGHDAVAVEAHGNIFAATAYLYGLALEELDTSDLDVVDETFSVIVAARAANGGAA